MQAVVIQTWQRGASAGQDCAARAAVPPSACARRAIGEDQRGDAHEGVGVAHRVEVAKHRARIVLEGKPQHAKAPADATYIWRIVMANENHVRLPKLVS